MDQLVTTVRQRDWMEMIRQQHSSGLTIKEWCHANGISENCYYYRQNKLRKQVGRELPVFAEMSSNHEEMIHNSKEYLENMNRAATITIGNIQISLTNHASADLIENILRSVHA